MFYNKSMMLFLFLATTFQGCSPVKDSSYLAEGVAASPPSYGQLAKQMLSTEFGKLSAALAVITKDTLPHETKDLRKQIGSVRQMVDVFAYAYEPTGDPDIFLTLRDELDVGYETMGAFKDLFDGPVANGADPANITYKKKDLKKYGDPLLAWLEKFLKPKRLGRYLDLLSEPLLDSIADRKRSKLSRFYWGGVDIKPKPSDSGVKTISRLVHAQLKESKKAYKKTLLIDDLTDYDNEENFHDFRKRVRASLQIINGFDLGIPPGFAPATLLSETVSRYGDINDFLISFHKAKGDKKRELKDKINASWAVLLQWQIDQKIDEAIDQLQANLKE